MKQFIAITENNEVIGNQSFLTQDEAFAFATYHGVKNFQCIEWVYIIKK
jgi:hypothetical protein